MVNVMNINGIPAGYYKTPNFYEKKHADKGDSSTGAAFYEYTKEIGEELQKLQGESKKESEQADARDDKESETKTNLIVRPDGSKVLEITMKNGEIETTMTLLISKPSVLQGESRSGNIGNHTDGIGGMKNEHQRNTNGLLSGRIYQ